MKRLISLVLVFVFLISSTGFAQKHIEINIPSRTLMLFDNDKFVKVYPVAAGRPSHDSPVGHYRVLSKVVNPTWRPKGQKPVPPGPTNPLGTRWIGFYSDYGIHGNSNPNSIGTYASKGCIRMFNYDVEELFNQVQPGNDVDIYYNTIYTYGNPDKSKAALIVYPDLYNRGINKTSRIKQELDKLGLADQIDSKKLDKLYKNINKKTVIFAKAWTLFVNGEFISPDTKMRTDIVKEDNEVDENKNSMDDNDYKNKIDDKIGKSSKDNKNETNINGKAELPVSEKVLVNIYDINLLFGLDLKVGADGTIKYKDMPIYYEIQNSIPYVSVLDSIRAIEGYYNIDMDQEKIDWIITYGKLDGKFFRLDLKITGHEVYASVRDIVNELGLQGDWNEEKSVLTVNGKEIKGKLIGDRIYITPEQIKEYFGLDSSYSSYQNRLELFSNSTW